MIRRPAPWVRGRTRLDIHTEGGTSGRGSLRRLPRSHCLRSFRNLRSYRSCSRCSCSRCNCSRHHRTWETGHATPKENGSTERGGHAWPRVWRHLLGGGVVGKQGKPLALHEIGPGSHGFSTNSAWTGLKFRSRSTQESERDLAFVQERCAATLTPPLMHGGIVLWFWERRAVLQ